MQRVPKAPNPQETMKYSGIIVPANCTDNISQEEIEALKAFIVSIGKHRVYVDTAYDLDPLEIEDTKNEGNTKKINIFVLAVILIQQFL